MLPEVDVARATGSTMTARGLESSPDYSTYRATLLPTFIARLSGLPFDAVTELRSRQLDVLLSEYERLISSIRARRELVSDTLFGAVGQASDKRTRGALVEIRRDLFNARVPSESMLARALGALEPGPHAIIQCQADMLRYAHAMRGRLAAAHESAMREARRSFRIRLRDERFLKGLLLSSRSLHRNVSRYLAHNSDEMDSRLEHVERGLLRYFTRAATKATPFATFCTVLPGRIQALAEDAASPVQVVGNVAPQRSVIRLNRRLFSALWTHLKTRPAVRRALTVKLNTTVRPNGDRWVFLARVAGREVFQRLMRSEALEVVLSLIRQRAEATLDDLIEALTADPSVDTTFDSAVAYLDALVDCGLLTFRTPVDEQDPDWPEPLRLLLAPIEDEHAQAVAGLLRRLQSLAQDLKSQRATARVAIVDEMQADLDQARDSLGMSFDALNNLIYYEDATADGLVAMSQNSDSAEAVDALIRLVQVTQSLAYPRALQATMRHFFDSRFADRRSVPLLEFYERFYREHFKDHQEKEARLRRGERDESLRDFDAQNPFKLPSVSAAHAASKGLTALYHAAWKRTPGAQEVDVSGQDLEAAIAELPEATGPFSSAFFCHGVSRSGWDGNVRLIVLNAHHSVGYGKYFSRFLHLLPPHVTEETRQANSGLTEGILAEICGDGDFNADMHPALLPWSIADPTAEVGSSAAVTPVDLDVTADQGDGNRLRLVHRLTGRTVLPVDLGFRNPRMRPPLFQLISYFAPSGSFAIHLPESLSGLNSDNATDDGRSAAIREHEASTGVQYRPRMTYDGRIILARRRWAVADGHFPLRLPSENDADYFIRVNEWRLGHAIPHEVYVRVDIQRPTTAAPGLQAAPSPEPSEGEVEELDESEDSDSAEPPDQLPQGERAGNVETVARYSRDWRKPQYVDFRSPMLVNLFGRLTRTLGKYRVLLEERFPAEEDLPLCDGERYAAEYVLQVSRAGVRFSSTGSPPV